MRDAYPALVTARHRLHRLELRFKIWSRAKHAAGMVRSEQIVFRQNSGVYRREPSATSQPPESRDVAFHVAVDSTTALHWAREFGRGGDENQNGVGHRDSCK
jgi:hypothetical protein